MKIRDVELVPFTQPYADKEWRFALGAASRTDGLVVKIHTDEGVTGVSFAHGAPHTGEVSAAIRNAIENLFRPILIGKDPFDIELIETELDRAILGYHRSKASIDVALHDLMGKALNVPVYQLLGGLYRDEIEAIRIVPLKEPDRMAQAALEIVEKGYRALKIKVGEDLALDVARVRAIRKAVGEKVTFSIDANQGWTPKVAITALKAMEEYNVALAEQPVRWDDWDGLVEVRRQVSCLVEADESAKSVSDVYRLIHYGAVDAISIKTPKMGGLRNCKKVAALCQAADVRCRVGMGGASRMTAAADMHFIASTPNISFACEVGEFDRMLDDPGEGLEVVEGMLRVPKGPGLGIRVKV